MNTIGELLAQDLKRKIEEIIQVDQADEQSVYEEITEYNRVHHDLGYTVPSTKGGTTDVTVSRSPHADDRGVRFDELDCGRVCRARAAL
jgi:hypothetical protein